MGKGIKETKMKDYLEIIGTAFICALILVIGVPLLIVLGVLVVALSPIILILYLINIRLFARNIEKFTKEIASKIKINAEAERVSTTVS